MVFIDKTLSIHHAIFAIWHTGGFRNRRSGKTAGVWPITYSEKRLNLCGSDLCL
jgi:hypothetical protein